VKLSLACHDSTRATSIFLNLATRWRWVVSFKPRPFYNREQRSRNLLKTRLGRCQNRKENLLPLPAGNWTHITKPAQVSYRVKAWDTLSSRRLSSWDVTSAVGLFNIEFWRRLTLLSLCLRHVNWRGALVTHFVRRDVCHVSRNVWANRNLRGVLACQQTRAPRQITWRKQNDKSEYAPEFNVKYSNCTRNITWSHVTWE
jgi:hypothetical protein